MAAQQHQTNTSLADISLPQAQVNAAPDPGNNHTSAQNNHRARAQNTDPIPIQGTNPTLVLNNSLQNLHPTGPDQDDKPVKWYRTYIAGFVNACVLLPTITALLTIFFYFLLPTGSWILPIIPWIPFNRLSVLVTGVLSAFLTTLIVAFFRSSSATYPEGNEQSYSFCEISLNKLETHIPIMKHLNSDPSKDEADEDRILREVGLREAESALLKAKKICQTNNGYQWITGAGYAYLQQALYQTEEALIKVEPITLLISQARHDQAALQDANMSNSKQLSAELQRAIEDLNEHYAPPKKQKNIIDFLHQQLHHYLYSQQQQHVHQQHNNTAISAKEKERQARITIYHVRQILNDFRVNRFFELVQQRSNLVLAIMVTGVITYILVSLVLLGPILDADKSIIFLASMAYFFVGAAAGLFGRLYSVSTADRTFNSYGLPTTRTNAAAHLSGVAGVGGVFVTQALLQIGNLTFPGHPVQPFAFSLPNLLIAATFGLTPNLLIKNLQRQAEKSISDLESTKPSVLDKNSN